MRGGVGLTVSKLFARQGQLFRGAPAAGLLQRPTPLVRLALFFCVFLAAAFAADPAIIASLIAAELFFATISFIDLPSVARTIAVPLLLMVLPSWTLATLTGTVPVEIAMTGVLRAVACILTGVLFIHSVGLRGIASLLETVGLPRPVIEAWRTMIAQAASFGDLLQEMRMARLARRITRPKSSQLRREIGSQFAVLLAKMLQAGRNLSLASKAREFLAADSKEEATTAEAMNAMTHPLSETSPLFEFRQVSHEFASDSIALDAVSLSIRRGGCTVLLGANGAGKSTVLHITAGLLTPTTGQVFWKGHPLSEVIEKNREGRQDFRRKVGFVFQDPDCQWLCETVREEVEFGPRQVWPDREARTRCDQVMVEMGINHLSHRAPYTLSGGEKKRVALASILSLDPDVLLLDEPTQGLDAATTDFLVDWLREFLGRPGKTIVLATHDMQLASELATDAIVLTPCHRIGAAGSFRSIVEDTGFLKRMNVVRRSISPIFHENS